MVESSTATVFPRPVSAEESPWEEKEAQRSQYPHYLREVHPGFRQSVTKDDSGLFWEVNVYRGGNRLEGVKFHTPQEAFAHLGTDLPPRVEPETVWKRRTDNSWEKWAPRSGDGVYVLSEVPYYRVVQNELGAWGVMDYSGHRARMEYKDTAKDAFGHFGDAPPDDVTPDPPRKLSDVEITASREESETGACPLVKVEGKLYHGSATPLDSLAAREPDTPDPFWRPYGGDRPAAYLTQEYPTAVIYADSAEVKCAFDRSALLERQEAGEDVGPIPDCEPKVYEVAVSMEEVADCREIRSENTDDAFYSALSPSAEAIRDAKDQGLDGVIIPSTLDLDTRGRRGLLDSPEFLSFNPQEDTKILGERSVGDEKTPDGRWVVEDSLMVMAQPGEGNGSSFFSERPAIKEGTDILEKRSQGVLEGTEQRAQVLPGSDIALVDLPPSRRKESPSKTAKKKPLPLVLPVKSSSGKSGRGTKPSGKRKGVPAEIRRFRRSRK